MKFKKLLALLLLTTNAFAVHVSDRSIYATDIKTKSGTAVFNFPTLLPTSTGILYTNADQEPVTSSNLTWDNSSSLFTLGGTGIISVNNSNNVSFSSTDHLTLTNPTGTQSHLVFKFGSTYKGAISNVTQGAMTFYSAGSDPRYLFKTGATIGSMADAAQIGATGIFSTNGFFTNGKVTAGAAIASAPGTLSSYGSFVLRGKKITTNYTATSSDAILYCDTSTSNNCTGTASDACSTHTSESSCNDHSEAGCSFTVEGNCSTFNNTDEATCEGASASCTYDQSSCSEFDNDETSCNSHDGCSFAAAACSDFGDETSCNDHVGNGCSWDGDSCEGTYTPATDGTCSGDYFNGTCSGGNYGTCGGTASCYGIDDETTCDDETGCSWGAGLTVSLPSIASTQGGSDLTGWLMRIKKVNAAGPDLTVYSYVPNGDTIEGSNINTISGQYGNVTVHPFIRINDCSDFDGNESGCNAAGCSWDGGEMTCGGGNYVQSRTWMKW